jgi:ParB family transcriptional regulator, chromosome partitioning protein
LPLVASTPARGARAFGLGRGLDALIPGTRDERGVLELPLDRIARNPSQPRADFNESQLGELAASIAVHGILQPIVVRSLADGSYELIAGERRLRAARMAGLDAIPAVIRDSDAGTDSLELALIENLQREDLNPIETAQAYRELIDRFGLTHEAVSRQVGKSRVAVSNALRLLDLAPETRQAIVEGRISEGHGRALAAITIPELQRAALGVVLERGLSVRQTEELVRRKRDEVPARERRTLSPDLQDLEAQLRGVLATKVGIVRTRRGGRLVIDFYSDEELDRLYSIITRGASAPTADEAASVNPDHEVSPAP